MLISNPRAIFCVPIIGDSGTGEAGKCIRNRM